jgi:hypothetical protein
VKPATLRRLALAVPAVALATTGCGWTETKDFFAGRARLERDREAHSQRDSAVRVAAIEVAPAPTTDGGASEIRLGLQNTRDDRLWVRVLVSLPEPDPGCEDVYPLDAMGRALAVCPWKRGIEGDTRTFSVEMTVYDDIGQTKMRERAELEATVAPDGSVDVVWK